jgi:hypothetical protein
MAFYRDSDGAIWQDGMDDRLHCIVDPDDEGDTAIGIPQPWYEVSESFGPIVEVRPSGWEEV